MTKYKGTKPHNIKTVSSVTEEGKRFPSFLIETNSGAKFKLDHMHRNAPMPKPRQDVRDWFIWTTALNDMAEEQHQTLI